MFEFVGRDFGERRHYLAPVQDIGNPVGYEVSSPPAGYSLNNGLYPVSGCDCGKNYK